jgi:hypothetical protein
MRAVIFLALLFSATIATAQQRSDVGRMADALERMQRDSMIRDASNGANRTGGLVRGDDDRSIQEMQMMDVAVRAQYCYQLAMEMANRAATYRFQNDKLAAKIKALEAEISKLEKDKRKHESDIFASLRASNGKEIEQYLRHIWDTKSAAKQPDITVKVQ